MRGRLRYLIVLMGLVLLVLQCGAQAADWKITQITEDKAVHWCTGFSFPYIVWEVGDDQDAPIFLYNIKDKTTKQIGNCDQKSMVHISGNHVLFIHGGELDLYDIGAGSTKSIAQKIQPLAVTSISENAAVWINGPRSKDHEVWTYDVARDVAAPITHDKRLKAQLAIEGKTVIWVESDSPQDPRLRNLHLYDLNTKATARIPFGDATHFGEYPQVAGDVMVYSFVTLGSQQAVAYLYSLPKHRSTPISQPDLGVYSLVHTDGISVVWSATPDDGIHGRPRQVFSFDIKSAKITQISDGPIHCFNPIVNGNLICWTSIDSFGADKPNQDVYVFDGKDTSRLHQPQYTNTPVGAGNGFVVFSGAAIASQPPHIQQIFVATHP